MSKKILVTGAGGFIGSHLCEKLAKNGYNVRALIHYNSRNNWGWLENSPLKKDIEIKTGDIRDFDSVKKIVTDCEQVYHLAALIGIPYSYESPLAYVKTNIEGTYNVLEASRQFDLRKVLITSTSEVYGTAKVTPIKEDHPLQPQSPYSASKIGADNISLSYFNSFKTPVVIARPFNTYGPRQSARAIIPTIITQLLDGNKSISLGNLEPKRDLTFVGDTVTGLIAIANSDSLLGKVVNIGTGQTISIKDIYEKISDIIGYKAEIIQDKKRIRPESSEVMLLESNNTLLKNAGGWKPEISIDEGLKQTIAWFKSNMGIYKTDIYNV